MEFLADPAYEQVDLTKASGYEYKDAHGKVQGPFPAIAFFTWSLKGLLPPTIELRRPGRREFHPMSDFESEILIVARIQLTNLMLDRKEWFYLDASQQVQGPFSASDITGYVATRYIKESVKFYGRKIYQEDRPPPLPDDPEFRTYRHLLDETMSEYRRQIECWRKEAYRPKSAMQDCGDPQSMENGSERNEDSWTDASSMRTQPLPILTPVPPASVDSAIVATEPSFDELRDTYAKQLFSDPEKVWYVVHNDKIFGPFEDMKWYTQLGANTQLSSTRKGIPFQSEVQMFASFEDHLKQLHHSN